MRSNLIEDYKRLDNEKWIWKKWSINRNIMKRYKYLKSRAFSG